MSLTQILAKKTVFVQTLVMYCCQETLKAGIKKSCQKSDNAPKNVRVYRFIEESGKKSGTYQSGYLFGVEMIWGMRGKTVSVKA